MATRLEALDELLSLAAHAGMLGSEAITANAHAYAKRDRRLTARAREARKAATIAEQRLTAARARFLGNTGSWNWSAEVSEPEPTCVVSMSCLCMCHAAGMPASEPCDTSEERARKIARKP